MKLDLRPRPCPPIYTDARPTIRWVVLDHKLPLRYIYVFLVAQKVWVLDMSLDFAVDLAVD